MGRIGPRRNRRSPHTLDATLRSATIFQSEGQVAGPAAGPALLAQEAWLMSVSLVNWQMRTKPKELGRPDGPHG